MKDLRKELLDYTMYLRGEGIDLPLARDVVYVDEYLESKNSDPPAESLAVGTHEDKKEDLPYLPRCRYDCGC